MLALGACSPLLIPLPPPPGALFRWSHVGVSDIPASRPLAPVAATWRDVLHGTPPVPEDCDDAACRRDPAGWTDRCLRPRAAAMASEQAWLLRMRGHWHPDALAVLATAPLASDSDAACGSAWQLQQAAGTVLRALGGLAAAEQAPRCRGRVAQFAFGVHEIDRANESFGQWLRHDYPEVVRGAFVGVFTGATVVPMGDTVSRIATLDLVLDDAGGRRYAIAARGGASMKVGSIKAYERDTPLPPELVPVAFGATLAQLDARLAAWVAADCRPPR